MSNDPFQPKRRKETTEQTIKRLQARIAGGDDHLRSDLAEVLLQSAQEAAGHEQLDTALRRIDEALKVVRQLVQEGHYELKIFIGRALLFRAALTRFHVGAEAGVIAFNEVIRYFVEEGNPDDPAEQNELAVALMSKADVLMSPLGAYAAALAAQEQAAKIWQHLVNLGSEEFRLPLVNALTACGDSKAQSGDIENAIRDLRKAAEVAQDGVESGDNAAQPLLVQALLKLTRHYEQTGNLDKAFETIRESIRTVNKLIDAGFDHARMMFTALYLELGMLYERIRNIPAALIEFDRCRDVFAEMFRSQHWGEVETYMIRTGMANVLMCRGNMLAELNRFDEAAAAYDESVWQYQSAAELPPAIADPTFITYSVGVVQLNHANMLVGQGKLTEAVELKGKAIDALRSRYKAGHTEILPNLIAAYRKMLGIRQLQKRPAAVFAWMNELVSTVEAAVDEGKLEFRIDLGILYRQRSALWEEHLELDDALDDVLRALRLFRTIADDNLDDPAVHKAKVQWAELMLIAATILVKQEKRDEAFEFLHKEIAEIVRFYEEGNEHIVVDVLLGYTQFAEFTETFVQKFAYRESERERIKKALDEGKGYCQSGISLCRKQFPPEVAKNLFAKLFFMMKTAVFYKMNGIFTGMQKDYEEAGKFFAVSVDHWRALLAGLENVKAKDKYDAAERGEPIPNWDIPGGADDPYQERYLFYTGELRQTMHLWAKSCLQSNRKEEAKQILLEENMLAREQVKAGVPNADRYLVMSLLKHAEYLVFTLPPDEVAAFYEETLELLQKRFESGDFDGEDYQVLKHVADIYSLFLRTEKLVDRTWRLVRIVSSVLENVPRFPPPELWLKLCKALDVICKFRQVSLPQRKEIYLLQQKLTARFPDYETFPKLKRYGESLEKKIDR
jgi:tetratricopeptide (TPR) repeat protein